jgi:hypothetical protein
MMSIAAMRSGAPELAVQSAMGNLGAKDALATLYGKIAATEFEIQMNDLAVERARAADQAKAEEWRTKVQELPAEEIVKGISKGGCCSFCVPGSYCAITGSVPEAAGTCSHPELSKHLQFLDETGRRHFRYEDNPRAAELYRTACKKLKVSPS